jgi:hypothetical protein
MKGNGVGMLSAPVWIKSQGCESANCVEVAQLGADVMIRDSWDPAGPVLRVSREDWNVFAAGIANGDFRFE